MTPLALLLPLATPIQAVDAPTLEFYQDYFVVRKGVEAWRAPAHPQSPKPVLAVAFRRNQHYAVWDERGLTIRHCDRVRSTSLPDVPTAPRLFPREEILKTIDLLHQVKRKRNAAGLSGAMRIGNEVFFLIRWEEASGKPWMEALVIVDLSGESLHPKVAGKFDGLSVAYRPIDDRLFRLDGIPAVVTTSTNTWGISTYDPKVQKFGFRPLGAQLSSMIPLGRDRALFIENSAYGTTVGGEVDLEVGLRKERFESRGKARFVDAERPWLMVTSRDASARLRNGDTGTETPIPAGSGVQRAGPYVVVYTPYAKPTSATLYEPERWTKLATWKPKAD